MRESVTQTVKRLLTEAEAPTTEISHYAGGKTYIQKIWNTPRGSGSYASVVWATTIAGFYGRVHKPSAHNRMYKWALDARGAAATPKWRGHSAQGGNERFGGGETRTKKGAMEELQTALAAALKEVGIDYQKSPDNEPEFEPSSVSH